MTKKTKFICVRYPSHKVTVVPTREVIVEGGALVRKPGKTVYFSNGEYVTDDEQIIEYLRGHPWFKKHIVEMTPEEEEKIRTRARVHAKYKDAAEKEIAELEAKKSEGKEEGSDIEERRGRPRGR